MRTRTRDARPWWWWMNPWLYIKRRDIAYDTALDIIAEQSKFVVAARKGK